MLILKKYLAIISVVAISCSLLVAFQGQLFAAPGGTSPQPSTTPQHSFACHPKPNAKAQPPSRSPKENLPTHKQHPKICADGSVPQPTGQSFPKGLVKPPKPTSLHQAQNASGYLYADAYEFSTGIGAQGNFTQPAPYLASRDSHTLAELAGESGDGQQVIEIGWTVDRALNGDAKPHLFVFSWVNGQTNCYNGCGYVQYSDTVYPGMTVDVTDTPQTYAIQNYNGDWWLWYGDQWLGYFPGSIWSDQGVTFNQLGLTQWFGEVAANGGSHTQMGNGRWGDGSNAASISNMQWITDSDYVDASASSDQPNANCYDVGNFSGNSFTYGGPGC